MKTAMIVLTMFAALVAHAEDKKPDFKKLLVGKWKVVKADEGALPVGSVVVFTSDGKLTVTSKMGDKEDTHSGTYVVEDKGFSIKLDFNGQEFKAKITIKKITDAVLETADENDKAVTCERVK